MLHSGYTDIKGLERFGVEMRVDPMDHLRRPMTGKRLPRQNAVFPDALGDCGMPEIVNSEPWTAGLPCQSSPEASEVASVPLPRRRWEDPLP